MRFAQLQRCPKAKALQQRGPMTISSLPLAVPDRTPSQSGKSLTARCGEWQLYTQSCRDSFRPIAEIRRITALTLGGTQA
jgi:hypothetical protein